MSLTDVIRRAEDLPDFGALEDHSRDLEVAQLDVTIRERAHHDQILRLQGEKENFRGAERSALKQRTRKRADCSPIRASGLFRASTSRRSAGLSSDGFIAAITSGIQSVFRVLARDKTRAGILMTRESDLRYRFTNPMPAPMGIRCTRDHLDRGIAEMSRYIHFASAQRRGYPRAYLLPRFTNRLFISSSPRFIRNSEASEGRRARKKQRGTNVPRTGTSPMSAARRRRFRRVFATRADEWRHLSPLM